MKYSRWYRNVSAPFRKAGRAHALKRAGEAAVAGFALAYFGAVAVLALSHDARLFKAVAVPLATFCLASCLRALLDRPRPYEAHELDPLVAKRASGKSMPSRHVASAMAVTCLLWWLNPPLGAVALIACVLLAAQRVVAGVHYPRDVIAAIALSFACGLIGYLLVP